MTTDTDTPMLIHVGYPKAGSSWLQEVMFAAEKMPFELPFDRRSDVYIEFIEPEQARFSPDRARQHFGPVLDDVREAGKVPVLSSEALVGSPHSGGYDRWKLLERLNETFPEAKILMIVREQRAMILSCYGQYVRVGGACSVNDYLRPPFQNDKRFPSFDLRYFQYHELAEAYAERFGADNLTVLPLEMLKKQPGEFMRGVCRAVGLEDVFEGAVDARELSDIRTNPSLSTVATSLKRRINSFFVRSDVNPGAPFPWLQSGNRYLVEMLRSMSKAVPEVVEDRCRGLLENEVEALVGKRYAASNRQLEKLADCDLESFDYQV